MPEKRKSARLAATPSSSAEVKSQTPPDAERPAKRIKQKGRSDFPDTDDADVILTIGDTTLYLNSKHLSRSSRFFSEFQPNQLPVTAYLERQGGSLYYAKAYRLRFFTVRDMFAQIICGLLIKPSQEKSARTTKSKSNMQAIGENSIVPARRTWLSSEHYVICH